MPPCTFLRAIIGHTQHIPPLAQGKLLVKNKATPIATTILRKPRSPPSFPFWCTRSIQHVAQLLFETNYSFDQTNSTQPPPPPPYESTHSRLLYLLTSDHPNHTCRTNIPDHVRLPPINAPAPFAQRSQHRLVPNPSPSLPSATPPLYTHNGHSIQSPHFYFLTLHDLINILHPPLPSALLPPRKLPYPSSPFHPLS